MKGDFTSEVTINRVSTVDEHSGNTYRGGSGGNHRHWYVQCSEYMYIAADLQ